MKRVLISSLILFVAALNADEMKVSQPAPGEVIHVATALDHLTVLEFGEPVAMAAAGSTAFQIERHEDKVFIKPLKTGVSTDLFVWTASRRFSYELEPPGEAKNMNFAVDSRLPAPTPTPDPSIRLEDVADMMLTQAFLGAQPIDSQTIKPGKDRITVRIEHVLQSRNTLYIHYSILNQTALPYRITRPTVVAALAPQSAISIMSLEHTQLDGASIRKLGDFKERQLTLARAEVQKEDIQPGEQTQGVVAIREPPSPPTILQMTFGPEGDHKVQAAMVF